MKRDNATAPRNGTLDEETTMSLADEPPKKPRVPLSGGAVAPRRVAGVNFLSTAHRPLRRLLWGVCYAQSLVIWQLQTRITLVD